MDKRVIKLYNVVDNEELPQIIVEDLPSDGDPIELNNDMYYVCERLIDDQEEPKIGVIPLVVRNPSSISNIDKYLHCLSMAHRRVQFRNKHGYTDFAGSEEMIIT